VGKIRVLIVDDQDLFASGIEIILRGEGKDDIQVVGKASDGQEAIRKVETLRPDVILMDVRMPVMDGVEATRIIHEMDARIRILILTTFEDDSYVLNALANGAVGYVLKNIKPAELVMSIKAVAAGNLFVSSSVGDMLVRQASAAARQSEERPIEYRGEVNFLRGHFDSLRNREAEILHFLLQDYDNFEIAERLAIAEQTVKNYISVIYDKLGVNDRDHAKRLVKSVLSRGEKPE
jgi:DNA-binding NarL/FixJ family response regulator